MSDDAPMLYVRRTKSNLWHWMSECPLYPQSVLGNNALVFTNIAPHDDDRCPVCVRLSTPSEESLND